MRKRRGDKKICYNFEELVNFFFNEVGFGRKGMRLRRKGNMDKYERG